MKKLEDDSPMPFGKHGGKEMQEVPASYLLYIHSENAVAYAAGEIPKHKPLFSVMEYIEDNMQVLEKERDEKLKTNNR